MNLSYSNTGTSFKVSILKISFLVAKTYQSSGYSSDSPSVDVSKTGAASASKSNALTVVTTNSSKTDYEKLIAYRDYICEQVSYNQDAASNSYTGGYGDPWQLIYVFDNNSNTNVVCEGYSKAFMYLCDLSTWQDSSLSCYLVTGVMAGGTGAGNHMWNIVTMGNQNYLVDVTNSDSSSVGVATSGASSPLFLVGSSTGSIASGYSFTIGNQMITYTYDQDTKEIWGSDDSSILKLALGNVDNNVQSEVDTWDEFISALAEPSISKITISGDITSPQGENDDPFLITRDVTIYGTDNKYQITLNNGGIILGGNVKFEQIKLNFTNYARNIIIANGHSLIMSGVSQEDSHPIHMFCGTITGYSGNIPTVGNSGKIIFEGNNQLGNVYAGSFAEPNQIDQGNNNYISNPGTSNEWTKPSTITVSPGATYSGQIYGHGAWEKRDGTDPWGMVADSISYKVTGDVTINLTNGSLVVDAETGGRDNATVNYVAAKADLSVHKLLNVGHLVLSGTSPNLEPAIGSTIGPAASITLSESARLDITNLKNTPSTDKFTIGALNGGGLLVFKANQNITVTGTVTATTDIDIYGGIRANTTYIWASTSKDNSFTLTNSGYEFQKNDVGEWAAVINVYVKPDSYNIPTKTYQMKLDTFKESSLIVAVECSLVSPSDWLTDVPMEITIKKDNGEDVSAKSEYIDGAGYVYSVDELGIYSISHDDFNNQLTIATNPDQFDFKPGVYTIKINVVLSDDSISENEIIFIVTDDTQTPVPDAEFNPKQPVNGWYLGLRLYAPTGYKIATTENGNFDSFIEIPNGEHTDYSYWLKSDTGDAKAQKTIASLRVDDEFPVITKHQVSDITPTTAKINVTATDQVSGLTVASYVLGIANVSGGNKPTIGVFSGTRDGGFFEISGMTANVTYVFNLIVKDVAGNETVEEVTIVAGKNNLSSGQLSVKNGTTYIYDGTELKPGADQLVLTINGQPISLNDADYTYTYSNNINVGSNARVTVTATDSNTAYSGAITGTFTIGSRPITITPKSQTIRNGHQIQTGVGQVDITNHVSGHTLEAITLSQDNTKKKIEASNAVIKDTTQKNVTSNYQITYNEGNLTIVDPVITIQVKNNIVYDGNSLVVGDSGTQNDVTYTLKECSTPVIKWYKADAGGIKGEEFTGTPKDAGNYIIEISATVDNNLGTVTTEKQVTIQKVPLTATVSNKTLTYGDMFSQPGNTVTYSGFVGSDSAETVITGGIPQFSTNYVQYQNKGTYNITADLSAISAVNYEIKVVPGTLTVTPRQATLTWNNYENRIYGDGKSVTATISNLVNNDKVTVAVSGANATEVGTHTATATGLMGEKAANYTLSAGTTQNYTIAKATAPTNVTAQRNVKWSKGGTETFAVTDFSLPANVNHPKITKVTKNIGETADDLGIFANNSQVVNGQVSFSLIKPSIYKEGQKGVFDVTITSDTHEDITAKLILNIIDREVVDSNLTLSVANITYGQLPAPKGSFSGSKATNVTEVYKYSKDGTVYQELDSLKNTSGFLPAGDYSVQYSYTDDEQIGTKTVAFRVEKKELNIRFDVEAVTKEYDGTTSVPSDKLPTLIIKEAVGSEQPKLVNTGVQFTYDSIQAGEGKTIQVTGLSLDTSESVNDNYTVQSTVSSVGAIITPKKATVLPKTAYTKQYGEKDPVLEYKVTGLIGQDTLEGVLKRAAGENVGSYSYDISGLKNQNYKVELDASSSKFDITKAEAQLTLEADLAAQKAGGKVTLTASAKSKKELEVSGAAQPTAAELTGVSFTEKTAGVFEGVYIIPENAKAGDKIIITVTLKDANYKEVAAKTVIQVIEEELQALPVPQEKPEAEGDKKPSYKLAMEQGISKVPDGLKKLGHLDTVEEIRDALKLEIKKLHWEITDATSAIYDVTLWYHPGEDDSVWQKADKNHWPKSGKITVVLPYPEGTGKNTHNFNVTHMFTVEMNNNKPGTFEYPTVEKTDEGISFQVSGLSPITLGWTRIQEALAPNPGSGNSTGGSSDSSEDSSFATTTTVIKRQEVKKEEAKATDTTAVAVAKEPRKQKNTKVTVKKEEKEVADNNVVSEKPEATQQTEDAVKEITEEVQEIEGIEEASEVPQDTTQKVQEETKSSSVLWIAAIVALAAAGVVSFILWKNKKNEEA